MRASSSGPSAFCRLFGNSIIDVVEKRTYYSYWPRHIDSKDINIPWPYPLFTRTEKINLENNSPNVFDAIARCQVKGAGDPLGWCCCSPTRSRTSLVQTRRVSEAHER
jgi:hypothetical protein